jgi:4-alpha-glucanotransferase
VTLAVSITPEGDEICPPSHVYLCYAYGLYQFMESRQRMVVRQQPWNDPGNTPLAAARDEPDTCDYVTSLNLPAEPGLFFYWLEIQSGENRVYYTCDLYGDGSGWLGHHRPHYQPGDAHHPFPFQITVYTNDFKVPSWMSGAVLYQIFPDRFHRDRDFSEDRFARVAQNRPERIFHVDWDEEVDYTASPKPAIWPVTFSAARCRGSSKSWTI